MNPQNLLLQWLSRRLKPDAQTWLRDRCAQLSGGASEGVFYTVFSQSVRHAGKAPLEATTLEQAEAYAFHPGWDLSDWTRDQATRAALLLGLSGGSKTVEMILSLYQTADLGEHLALARSLFLMPDAKALIHIAREAIRSNTGDLFAAISQRNPYPAEHCDEIAWNQMVVKCLFVDLPLHSIYGFDQRLNAELSRIVMALAKERRSAGRALSSEAWLCVAPFADEEAMQLLKPEL